MLGVGPQENLMKFGERLKQLREAQGTTQRALAAALGMEAPYLSRIENSVQRHTPSRDTIERMVTALGLSVAQSDELHILAGKIPAGIEAALFNDPKLMALVRRRAK